ncbi:MAG: tRNA (adenosine(37)-N6)-threonylcarbamoyltransferase complex ATPase subunit type 1 TsaE [Candidatus Schmidhempelia sp.]|nr:tRNA (adenosine(37)-N6)-threonylcarbamoyltransferase complex ATPase subunit type 1 TsaE [Candidatus Schmidhempelia sp.]
MNKFTLSNEEATLAFGGKLALACKTQLKKQAIIIYLLGDLGAGKTTLSRGFVHGLGYQGTVKSPTYTLVEPYQFNNFAIYHFDLYRLSNPEELEFMGIRDYFSSRCICLIEWPQCAHGFLPTADLTITLDYFDNQRQISLTAATEKGQRIMSDIID